MPDKDYDTVLTNFYLDLFSDAQLMDLIAQVKMHVSSNALWLVTDFETHSMLQHVKVRLMYLFFRMMTGLKTQALPGWYKAMEQAGCVVLKNYYTQRKFIRSAVFRVKTN